MRTIDILVSPLFPPVRHRHTTNVGNGGTSLIRSLAARAQVFSPLCYREYAILWLGQTISLLGDRAYTAALPFLVLSLGGNASQLSAALIFSSVPRLLFLLVGGVAVDRVARRFAILVTDLTQATALAVIASTLVAGSLRIWHVYALSAVFGSCSAFTLPAARGIIPEVVPDDALVAANALSGISREGTGILGPLMGAALVASGGVTLAFGADAVSFVLSALCMAAIGAIRLAPIRARLGRTRDSRVSFVSEIKDGFRLIAASQWLWATIVLFSVGNIFLNGSLAVGLPLLAQERLGGPKVFGWVLSGIAGGSMLGAFLLGRSRRLARRGLLAYGGVALGGVALVLLSVSSGWWQAVCAGVLLGSSITVFSLVWDSTIQELVPREALGRVFSVDLLGSFALLPVGYLAIGLLVTRIGAANILLLGGVATIALAFVGLSLRSIRMLD